MINAAPPQWADKRTDETRRVEEALKNAGFEKVDAYRYNSASIRVRIVSSRFEGMNEEERDRIVEPVLETLPESTQGDIITLLMLTPDEISSNQPGRSYLVNIEFEDPSPSML